jgi:trans-aconitate 3-methyltransferase
MATDDSANFWKVNLGSEDAYWRAYEATRPNYADSGFYDHIYSYHSAKPSAQYDLAHDVGCGSGVATNEFAERFHHVVASDPNESSLGAARRRWNPASKAQLDCIQSDGETLADTQPHGSADLVGAAECLPLMDGPAALNSFAKLLKPEGTLAIWFYGRPHFSDPAHAKECQRLFDAIQDLAFTKVVVGGGPARKFGWKRAADGMDSWLDYLDLSSSGHWNNIVRRKWNSRRAKMGFFGPAACDFDIEPANNVGPTEEIIELEDSGMWKGSWDIEGVKEFVKFSFPNFREQVEADINIMHLFDDLEVAMGGATAVRNYTWPVVLVLASRSHT